MRCRNVPQAHKLCMTIEVFDPRIAKLAQSSGTLERLCTGAVWSEGPVWMREDNSVLWSDIPNNRILRWQARAGMSVWREKVEFTNGHAREHGGALLHCSHGLRAVVRTRFGPGLAALSDEIVVNRFQGGRLNSPNDLVVKSDGSIWFTDPPYGIASNREGHQGASEQGGNYVFRFDPASQVITKVSDFVEEPNGLVFSPDEAVLYVSDTSAALRRDGGGHHHIVAFDVVGGNALANPRVFASISPGLPDGMSVDVQGYLYTSSEDSVQIFHPDGTRVGKIAVPEKVGNLVFGGLAGDELFICASTSLYRIQLSTQSAPTWNG